MLSLVHALPWCWELFAEANKTTPVLLCHGTADRMNPYELAQQAAQGLRAAGAKLQFKTYVGMGTLCCALCCAQLQPAIVLMYVYCIVLYCA